VYDTQLFPALAGAVQNRSCGWVASASSASGYAGRLRRHWQNPIGFISHSQQQMLALTSEESDVNPSSQG
jgi:hypothetical protein